MLPSTAVLIGHYLYRARLSGLWLGCATLSTAVLAGGLWWAMPCYADRTSVGVPAARLAAIADELEIPVIAYRDDWDAATFYRGGRELPIFPHGDSAALIAQLRQRPKTLVLVRQNSTQRAGELRAMLPPDLLVVGEYQADRAVGLLIQSQGG
jgi:hypothetical protein